jgi:dihydroxyacetone kinase-like predicted kinase
VNEWPYFIVRENDLSRSSAVEGLSGLLAYIDETSTEENISRMEEAFGHMKTGEVALASRSTVQSDVECCPVMILVFSKGKSRFPALGRKMPPSILSPLC